MKVLKSSNATNKIKKLLKNMICLNHMRKTNVELLRANKNCKKPFLIKQSKYKTTVRYQKYIKTDTIIVTKFKGQHIQINADKYFRLVKFKKQTNVL